MSKNILKIKKRDEKGSSSSRRLRKAGLIPANLMMSGESRSILCTGSEFKSLMNAGLLYSSVIHLEEGGKETDKVIIRELQRCPITEDVLHIDFYKIEEGKKAVLSIPINQKGVAPGVKAGGVLNQYLKTINVRLLPEDIQEIVVCDVSQLGINDAIHVRNLEVPASWEILTPERTLILKVNPSRVTVKTADAENKVE